MQSTILILAANPEGTPRLRLDLEIREIQNGLTRARRNLFNVETLLAPRREDVRGAMNYFKPVLVHFCGHGIESPAAEDSGLLLESEHGGMEIVPSEILESFFRHFTPALKCVVLNACHSSRHASALSRHIDHVIGRHGIIDDEMAIASAGSFYEALACGRTVPEAFSQSLSDLRWSQRRTDMAPELFVKPGAPAVPLVTPPAGASAGDEDYQQDFAISHAGEDVETARQLAEGLQARGFSVFFAPARRAELVGERLEHVVSTAYASASRFVLVVVSDDYLTKDWPRLELQIANEEEERRGETFVIPLLLTAPEAANLPADKIYIDLRQDSCEHAVEILAEKVRIQKSKRPVAELFQRAFGDWRIDGLLPGASSGDLFWTHLDELDLDVERCEFLLQCPSGGHVQELIHEIAPEVLAPAAERLIAAASAPNRELANIKVLGLADPQRAEEFLWQIYEDPRAEINDRRRAFEEFWQCPSEKSRIEYEAVLGDSTQPWELRLGAASNVLWAKPSEKTPELLATGLRDPRREVRSKILDAFLRFNDETLIPNLMEAYSQERSRKVKAKIQYVLRHFNHRSKVVSFGRQNGFGPAFFRPVLYPRDWEESRESWG